MDDLDADNMALARAQARVTLDRLLRAMAGPCRRAIERAMADAEVARRNLDVLRLR